MNFAIFLVALLCFRFFLHEVIRFVHERAELDEGKSDGRAALPDWAFLLLGYSIFLWASLELVSLYDVSPDQAVLAFVCLDAGLLLRLRRNPTLRNFALLGLVLGIGLDQGNLISAWRFDLVIRVLMETSLANVASGAALSALVFLAVAAPLVLALSWQKGRPTFGDSGKLNYAWAVSPRTFWRNWQGDSGKRTPVHPTRQLAQHPPVFEFAGPIPGTYPPWADPSYWNDGLRWHFRIRPQMEVLAANFASESRLLFGRNRAW